MKVKQQEKEPERRISRENGDVRSRNKTLVNECVTVYESKWREDKEVRTGKAATKRPDTKGDRFINY